MKFAIVHLCKQFFVRAEAGCDWCYADRMFWRAATLLALASLFLPGRAAAQSLPTPSSSATPPPKTPDSPAEALHAAVRAGDLGEVERLIVAGTDVNARDALGSTPLLDAAWAGNEGITSLLLAHGADVNAQHKEAGSTALQYAVLTGRAGVARILLKAGARVDVNYRGGQSVLHVAASHGNPELVELLLAAHAEVTAVDANGNTPLDVAVLHNHKFVVETLLRNGADAKRVHVLDGRGPLHEACMKGYADLIPLLVEAGANPTGKDRFGQSPLDVALAYKNGNVVSALLHLGLHLKESQKAAEDAMEAATLRGQTEIARLLIENGLDVNKAEANGSSY